MTNDIHSITIKNCNNISSASIKIKQNTLNIKYAINGTGKSTIAKAINLAAHNKTLTPLIPFSFLAQKEKDLKPTVSELPFTNVMVFDEEYLKQYVYQKTDLIKDSFEVFINSPEYTELKAKIDAELVNIKAIARDKPNISKIKEVLNGLCQLIMVNKDGSTLSRKQSGVKSLLDGGKGAVFNPPETLVEFKTFFNDEHSTEWAAWKLKGISSFGEKGICPFCAEKETEKKKTQSKVFQETFDEVSINYANKIREYLMGISEYINVQKMESLLQLLNATADRKVLERELIKLRLEADYLFERLDVLSRFDGYSIDQSNMDELERQFLDMKLSQEGLDFFNTENFFAEINPINVQIDRLLGMVGRLKGEIANFQKYLREQIKDRKQDINDFLSAAGFNYTFDIVVNGDNSAHAVLRYCVDADCEQEVSNPDNHLSWGERNAFALLLFMFDAISKKADLVILDDPISSFDSNKKYAIINRLFKTGMKEHSLYQRTVLLLTHDFEPVIDYVQVGGKLSSDSVCAHYLQNKNGAVSEQQIRKNQDMMSMVVLMRELAEDTAISLPVRVGCLRKYIEHTTKDPKSESLGYNVLSSLVHGRPSPTYDSEGQKKMSEEDRNVGFSEIKEKIKDFDYQTALDDFDGSKLLSLYTLEKNNFFRLLILRAYTERNTDARDRMKKQDDVLRKYVDETYHIENDYLYSLDMRVFDIVPQHYIKNSNFFVRSEKAYLGKSRCTRSSVNSNTAHS